MKLSLISAQLLAISTVILALPSVSLADASGEWSISKGDCRYAHGVRDGIRISGNSISGLEWSCEVQSRSSKNGYTIAKSYCGAEGEDINTTLRYKLDDKGLHFKWGKQPERLYAYRCK